MKIEITDNCGRLIDADALKEAYSDIADVNDEFCKALCDAVDEAPTIWVGKKRKAYGAPHWVAVENDEMEITGYYCSNCDFPMETEEQTDYCPNCGVKMEKSEESD